MKKTLGSAAAAHEAEARQALRQVEALLNATKPGASCKAQIRTVALALTAAGRASAEAEGSGNAGLIAVADKVGKAALAKLNAAVTRCACDRSGLDGRRRS